MKTSVFIDSCAWNYLFDNRVDLSEVFPSNQYALFVTREIEIEHLAIPDIGKDGADKRELKSYIATAIASHNVQTTSVFGFASYDADGSLSEVQVYGGLDQGAWQSEDDRRWYDSNEVKQHLNCQAVKGSGLSKNQADASLAVRSFDSVILTGELRGKTGPLALAADQGGRIVYLGEVEQSGLSLKDYFESPV